MIARQVAAPAVREPGVLEPYASQILFDSLRADAAPIRALDGAVLYLDIVGSTALAHRYASVGPEGAENLADVLSRYFALAFAIIVAQGGDIVSMEGDSVLALWRGDDAAQQAAAAALALREGLEGGPLQQRLTVAAGRLFALKIDLLAGRRLLLLTGAPIRALEKSSAGCPPGGVVLPEGATPGRQQTAASPRRAAADASVAPFLPRPLVERIAAGEGPPPAEFRDLTSVMIRLESNEGAEEGLIAAVQAVDAALVEVGLGVAEASEGDKGVSLRVAVGAPPYVLDNNALGAVEAARRALRALHELGIAAGIGVATGRAFALEVGGAGRRISTLLGPVMNRAARLMERADRETLVCEATARATGDHFEFGEPVAARLRGEGAPTDLRPLLGRAKPLLRAASRKGLFGRDEEVRRLSEFFAAPAGPAARIAIVEGEAGVGKSRLMAFAQSLSRQRQGPTYVATAQSIEQETAYFAFRQILAQILADADRPETRIAALLQGDPLLQRAEALTDLLPLDAAAIGADRRLTGAARRVAIADILTRILKRAGPEVSLLIDDAHWLDRSSAWLLATLAPRLPGLIVTLAARLLYEDASSELRAVQRAATLRLTIGRLDRPAIASLVCASLGSATAPARLVEHVFARSEGLPLHTEQLVMAMRDQGLIVASADGRRVEANLDQDVDVVTLRDVILRRFDLLAPRRQTILKAASVLGRDFDLFLLHTLHPDRPEPAALRADLDALVEAGLLEVAPRGYAFRHVRIKEAIYELLPFAQRRVLHREAAEALERVYGAERAAVYAQLATHWENAEEPAYAAAYRLKAAERALHSFAHHDTLAQLRAIERAGGFRALLPSPADQTNFAWMFGCAAEELTDFETARPWLLRCAELAGIPVRTGKRALMVGILRETVGQALLRARLRRPLPQGPAAEREGLNAHLHTRLAEQAYFDGNALALLHDTLVALNAGERGGSLRDLVAATGAISTGLAVAGVTSLSRFYQRRSIALSDTLQPWDVAMARLQSAVSAVDLGDWPLMQSMASSGAAMFSRAGEHDRHASCESLLAFALLAMGEVARAEQGLVQFGEFAEKIDQPRIAGWVAAIRALIDLMTGRPGARALERLNGAPEIRTSPAERLLAGGLKAGAVFAAGHRAQAIAMAEACIDAMRDTRPISLAYHGAGAAVAVCLAVAEAEPADAAARRRANEAVRRMLKIAATSRAWLGLAYWLAGRAAALNGRQGKANAFYRKGLAVAERLGEPYETALCRRALGDAKASNALLERMGCTVWMEFGGEARG